MPMILPPTSERVKLNTEPEINQRIRAEAKANWEYYRQASPAQITRRVNELDQEWDTERVLETNFACLGLASVLLGLTVSKKYLILTGIASAFLLQHALQGWCPPLAVIRRLGVRTAEEINEEKTWLRMRRGDFSNIRSPKTEPRQPAKIKRARLVSPS